MRLDGVISRAGDAALDEHLPSTCRAVGSIPSMKKMKSQNQRGGGRDSSAVCKRAETSQAGAPDFG